MQTIRRIKIPLLIMLTALVLMLPLCTAMAAGSAPQSGDPNGDGHITISDYTMTRLHILDLQTMSGDAFAAADVNGDGLITISDYTLLRLHILGIIDITQGSAYLPLAGCVIGIDPGHQEHANYERELISPYGTATKAKVSAGTFGRFTGVREYVINLQVALKLRDSLTAHGATVIMTREVHDVDISNAERAVMMNDVPVDCWLRIHANGSSNPDIKGMFILVPTAGSMYTSDPSVQTDSVALAQALLDATLLETGAVDLGIVYRSDQTGFCWSSVPVCNIEMGHMTNEAEDNLLVSGAYQDKIVDGLVDGFVSYFGE